MISQFYNIQDFQTGFAIWAFIWVYLQITPLQMWLDTFYDSLCDSQKFPGLVMQAISLVWISIDCHKCLSFWLGLVFTGNPIVAISFAILATLLAKITK